MRLPKLHRPIALALAAVTLCNGCRSTPEAMTPAVPPQATSSAPPRAAMPLPAMPQPARLFILPLDDAKPLATDPDGTRYYLTQGGLRVALSRDGSVQRGMELIPYSTATSLKLPERLGSGFLFVARSSGDTLLWRADSWTGKLVPFAQLGFIGENVVPGFDRIYVQAQGTKDVVAIDPKSGALTDLGSVPTAPGYQSLAFADSWLGAIQIPLRGILVTFDAGASWRSLGSNDSSLVGTREGKLVVQRGDDLWSVDASGDAEHLGEIEDLSARPPTPAASVPAGPLGRLPLREAVLFGWPDTKRTAVVAARGALGRVRLRDGAVLASVPQAMPPGDECHGIPWGDGFGFVCGREGGATVVYAFDPPLGLRPIFHSNRPRYVAAGGGGALTIRGPCTAPDDAGDAGLYCIIGPNGRQREIQVRGDRGVERVVALRDGRVAVIVPPRFGSPGRLTLVDEKGKTESKKLKLPQDGPKRAVLEQGLWLDGFEQTPKGALAGWAVAGGPFVGVRVALNGKVSAGTIEGEIERTLLSGSYAVTWGRSGLAAETVDGGFHWQEVDLPADIEPLGDPRQVRGCSPVGCAVGNWLRVGWRGRRGARDPLAEAASPAMRSRPSSQESGGRWLLECRPTGEVQRGTVAFPSRREPRPSTSSGRPVLTAETVQSTDWVPFGGVAPPVLGSQDVGLGYAGSPSDRRVHAYAWGGRWADWTRNGWWLVRGSDPFAWDDAVWSTAATRSPWSDIVGAARAFGHNVYGHPSPNWTLTLEPSGRGGVVFMSETTGIQAYLLEQGRSIQHVAQSSALGVSVAAGAVKVGGQWYIGARRDSFRVFALGTDEVRLLGDYPLLPTEAGTDELHYSLVRDDRARGLAIWVQANRVRGTETSWYVYPIDLESGKVRDPLVFPPPRLGTRPPACGDGDLGWVLIGSPPVSPYVDLEGAADQRILGSVRVRLIASARGLCLDALHAQAEEELPRPTAPPERPHRPTVPLIATDEQGQRWHVHCSL